MKILYTAVCYPPRIGGGELHLHRIAKELAVNGHCVHVINQWSRWRRDWLWGTTVLPDPAKEYRYEDIPVSQLGFPFTTRLKMTPWVFCYYGVWHLLMGQSVRHIARLMEPFYVASANSPEIVHAVRMGREFLVQAALSFSHTKGIPFVLTPVHHPRWQGQLYREYDKIYCEADAIIALTEYEKQMLIEQKGVRSERIHVTGIGPLLSEKFSVHDFRKTYGIHGPYVLFIGRHVEHKGYRAILEASPRVWERFPELCFVFVGPQTRQSVAVFGSLKDKRVHQVGEVDLATKTGAVAGCELFCMPSTQESFGGVYSEAWAFGKPVIGGRIPAIASVIDDGKDGFLCSQDPGELAEKICYLIEHPDLATAMGETGRRKVQERFTWLQLTEKTLNVYKGLL
jgi:glycosyltransferase involved in cell wall biosynthesis